MPVFVVVVTKGATAAKQRIQVRRLMQNPRGSRPSIAASARAGAKNARDSVIRIERSLLQFRFALADGERLDGLGGVN